MVLGLNGSSHGLKVSSLLEDHHDLKPYCLCLPTKTYGLTVNQHHSTQLELQVREYLKKKILLRLAIVFVAWHR